MLNKKISGQKVFQIGFNRCGTKFLTKMFESNGYISQHWVGGALAEDIAFSKAANIRPFARWPDATFFSDMESVHKPHRPIMLGFKEYKFLHHWFPDAIFILNKRDTSDWIASRFSHHRGLYKEFWAHHLGVDPSKLPDIWRDEWHEHFANVTKYFDGYEKFFIYDIDSNQPDDLARSMRPWIELPIIPNVQKNFRGKIRKEQKKTVSHYGPAARASKVLPDERFINSVSRHCIGDVDFSDNCQADLPVSNIYGKWDGRQTIEDQHGKELPIKFGEDGLFHATINVEKLDRTESVINEMISHGFSGDIRIDMQDSRRFGTADSRKVTWPLIVYNRQKKTTNMVLWPLPESHTLSQPHFVHPEPIDEIHYDDKLDRAVWRGSLSGQPNETLAPLLSKRRAAFKILEQLEQLEINKNNESYEEDLLHINEELLGITRYNLVARFFMSEDIDALLTLGAKQSVAQNSPLLSLFCGKREKLEWFFKSKYILSLAGHGTGSNFLMAANSNSVVMKEEDGWELFYTSEFKPWEHYIPLTSGALDVEEKLEWARVNPAKCKDMVKASQNVCSKFANPLNRKKILENTFDATQCLKR